MTDLTLYHAVPSRSATARWMLEEVGEPYDIHLLRLSEGEQFKPEYLAINPQGKVPALRHKDMVMTESAAICAYLADAFPEAGLAIPATDPRRGVYLQWLFFGPSCLEPAVQDRAFPRKEPARAGAIGYREIDRLADIVADAVAKGPYIMGEQFTAADVVIGSAIRWGTMFKLIPDRPAFAAYAERLVARPASQRADEKDKELATP
jgi:glutathione S-transferase